MRSATILAAAVLVLTGCASEPEPTHDPAADAIAAIKESAGQLDADCPNPPQPGSTQSCYVRNKVQIDAMNEHLGKIPATVGAMKLDDARTDWYEAWNRWNNNYCITGPGEIDCTLATTHANLNVGIIGALADNL